MISANFVFVGVFLELVGSLQYAISTVRGKTQPNRVSWLLWAIAPLIAFAAQIQEHVGMSLLLTFAVGFGQQSFSAVPSLIELRIGKRRDLICAVGDYLWQPYFCG